MTTYEPAAYLLDRRFSLNTIAEESPSNDEMRERESPLGQKFRLRDGGISRSTNATSPVPSLTSLNSSRSSSFWGRLSQDDSPFATDDESLVDPSIMTDGNSIYCASPATSLRPPDKAKRFPSLNIPSQTFWPEVPRSASSQSGAPPRPPKVPLSPAALSMIPVDFPTVSNTPSLTSLSTEPRSHPSSGPVTPESQCNPKDEEEIWGREPATEPEVAPVPPPRPPKPKISLHTPACPGWDNLSHRRQPSRPMTGPRSGTVPPRTASGALPGVSGAFPFSGILPPPSRISLGEESPVLGSGGESIPSGVQLPFSALVTLQTLSLDPAHIESRQSSALPEDEMRERLAVIGPLSPAGEEPTSRVSDYSISKMSVPSPSQFFSSLERNARHTWHFESHPTSPLPPSTATAEKFYNLPWANDASFTSAQLQDLPTPASAFPRIQTAPSITASVIEEPTSPTEDEFDENYERAIQESANKTMDRTTDWLAHQTSYLAVLRETNPVNDISAQAHADLQKESICDRQHSVSSSVKKVVRFIEDVKAKETHRLSDSSAKDEEIYYEAFRHLKAQSRRADAFQHRLTRSDSIQSARTCLPQAHRRWLEGKYRISKAIRPMPSRPISMMPCDDDDEPEEETPEQRLFTNVERERQALDQINARAWVIEASRYLAGGTLLNSPARNVITKPQSKGTGKAGKLMRVLDLGGLPHGDWGWHCAREFPSARIYTATTDSSLVDMKMHGPKNHRVTPVPSLWSLPFPDNYFHAISARSLHSHLKTHCDSPDQPDEIDLCLKECMRCLKPGGYLEFSLMDAELVNAGTQGQAISVEFGFNLKTRGYDPMPTRGWLGRVKRAGYDDIKRAWTFMPVGSPVVEDAEVPDAPPPPASVSEHAGPSGSEGASHANRTHGSATQTQKLAVADLAPKLEAVQGPIGSTADVSTLTGLVGSWAWEQWMLKLQMEMGGKGHLLEGVGPALMEGQGTRAGWRCLKGWARKPVDVGTRDV